MDVELALNQAQIINVTKRFYGDQSAYDPRGKKKGRGSGQKNKGLASTETKKKPVGQDSTMNSIMSGDWVEYYRKVQEFGKQNSWDTKKINKMLGDRVAFEKEYRMVSGQNIGNSSLINDHHYCGTNHC